MRTAGRCPPLMLTRPTPVSCEIFCARRVPARSSTWVSRKVAEGGEREEPVGERADQDDRRHQQRGRHRPKDKEPRRTHGATNAPSPPSGERVGVRGRIPERWTIPTSPSHVFGVGPFLSPLKGG